MSETTSLLWLRRDLRLSDLPALSAALAASRHVIPVYIHSEELPDRRGAASRWWLHHSLEALSKSLSQKGSRLILRQGKPVISEAGLAQALQGTDVNPAFGLGLWNNRMAGTGRGRGRSVRPSCGGG